MAIGTPSESPAIVVKEVDLTGVVPNVQSSTGAFVGNFRWGPVEQATLIDNEGTLASTFGAPNDECCRFPISSVFPKIFTIIANCTGSNNSAANASDISVSSQPTVKNDDAYDTQQSQHWIATITYLSLSIQVIWVIA
jgi:hypothetical protein